MNLSVFVINLDERVDRWKNVLHQQSLHDLQEITRISGVEAQNASNFLTSPAVGACWESHCKALREFLESDKDFALVLEDDFRIDCPDIHKRIRAALDSGLDFIQIGFLKTTIKESYYVMVENIYDSLIRIYGYLERKLTSTPSSKKALVRERAELSREFVMCDVRPGAHAYIVSKEAAKYLLQVNQPTFLSTDDLYMSLGPMRSIKMARFRKSCVGQTNSKSSINPR